MTSPTGQNVMTPYSKKIPRDTAKFEENPPSGCRVKSNRKCGSWRSFLCEFFFPVYKHVSFAGRLVKSYSVEISSTQIITVFYYIRHEVIFTIYCHALKTFLFNCLHDYIVYMWSTLLEVKNFTAETRPSIDNVQNKHLLGNRKQVGQAYLMLYVISSKPIQSQLLRRKLQI